MYFSYFQTRREVLDWMTAVGWYIAHAVDASGRFVFLLKNEDGECLCQGFDEDYCIGWADSYAASVVDEYNHAVAVAELAEAAFSIRPQKMGG